MRKRVYALFSATAVGALALANPIVAQAANHSSTPPPSQTSTVSLRTSWVALQKRSNSYTEALQLATNAQLFSKVPTGKVLAIVGQFHALQKQRAKAAAQQIHGLSGHMTFDRNDHHYFSGQKGIDAVQYFMPLITQYADQYGISPSIVAAVMVSESGGNPYAVSKAGAIGLMQINPESFSFSKHALYNPQLNIRLGTAYLSSLYRRYDGDVRLMAAAYNAGPQAVQHYKGVPPYAETRTYVRNVTAALGLF